MTVSAAMTNHCHSMWGGPLQRKQETTMSNGYVTFKKDKSQGNETELRGIEATKTLDTAAGAEFAWEVRRGDGSGTPPAPNSEVFFKVHQPFANTNIRKLTTTTEADFHRSKMQKVARFKPYKEFEHTASEALNRA